MAFDTLAAPTVRVTADMDTVALIDACGEMCPVWTAANPDRALALLFVAPHDGLAIDVLTAT
ncbi:MULTISPECIES: hypothetical protein [Brevundimonas]|uniref:hypothetical protein n=1 Tax=Brevundimonas TaxID=41275 RepID=UPI000F02BA5B|nr:hypothetical protein [Brevundimonas lutea]